MPVILLYTETNEPTISFESITTKSRMNQSRTSMESLSNELFCEIFDYLDGIQLYEAFSNLNQRFQQLITAPFLLLKIDDSTSSRKGIFLNYWKQMMNTNRHQIYSIRLDGSSHDEEFFLSSFILNSSFNHLESLDLWNFDFDTLMPILTKLPSLPRLFSLMISIESLGINLTDIYRLIFNLPMLKYYRFYTTELDLPVSLPMASDHQWTSIENLNINHCSNFHELINILSYTPQLRCLKFFDDSGRKLNPERFSPIPLPNLTSLSIQSYSVSFEEWEAFIRYLRPQLQVLHFIIRSQDMNFLHAHRWEQFIRQYLPQLEQFSLQYYEYIDKDRIFPTYPFESNQFISTFWIERKWFMDIEIDTDEIIYSIKPYEYRKAWCEYSRNTIVNSKSTRLYISGMHHASSNELLIKYIQHVLTITQVYHLDIYLYQMSLNTLIAILDTLPGIDSIKIRSIVFNDQVILSNEEEQSFASILAKNKIKKVALEQMSCIGEFAIFTTFFPSMTCFKVNDISLKDLLFYLLCMLDQMDRQRNNQLRLLCFRVPFIDDKLIEILQQIIHDQNLSIDFTVKRVLDHIYLQRQ